MPIHIVARPEEVAPTVLLCGDPLRAKHIAKTHLTKAKCYNQVRGMLGFTGYYQGDRVSIQSVGMGMPSMSIYAHELITHYSVKHLVRVGSAGAIQENISLGDVVVALSASTDSNMLTQLTTQQGFFAPTVSPQLLERLLRYLALKNKKLPMGNILTSDWFYMAESHRFEPFAKLGTLAIEMEVAALYMIAAQHQVDALALLTISDHLIRQERCSSEERQNTFNTMVEIALDVVHGL